MMKNWINKILKNKSYINWVTIGETNLGRPIWVLDITKGSPTDKPLYYFLLDNIHRSNWLFCI